MAFTPTGCPKCGAIKQGDWSQCQGLCPIGISPHYLDVVAKEYGIPLKKDQN